MNLSTIKWDAETVKYWLSIAALVDRALPPVRTKKCTGQYWPIVREWYEFMWDSDKEDLKPKIQATNEQVSMWEEIVLRWFKLIDSDKDKKIVWLRSCGMPYNRISKRLGFSRQTLTIRYNNAIERLAKSLNEFYHQKGSVETSNYRG